MSSSPSPSPAQHQQVNAAVEAAAAAAAAAVAQVPSSPYNSSASSSSNSSSSSSSSQFGDTTRTKVFVGGLAWETNRDGVRRHFEQYGEILEAVVITDKSTGRSKGYGFVTFRDPEGANRACADPTPVIDGRRANCNLASMGVRARTATASQQGRYRGPNPARSPARLQTPFTLPSPASPHHHHQQQQHQQHQQQQQHHPPPHHHLPFSYQQPPYPYPPYSYSHYQQDYIYPPPNMVYNAAPFFVAPPYAPLYGGGAAGGGAAGGAGPPPPSLQGNPATAIYAFAPPHPSAAAFQTHVAGGSPQNQPILSEQLTAQDLTAGARGPRHQQHHAQEEQQQQQVAVGTP